MVWSISILEENVPDFTGTWALIFGSSIACIFGASIVYIDGISKRIFKSDFRITESRGFLSASLGVSSGIMTYSSLVILLPEARHFLAESQLVDKYVDVTLMSMFALGTILAFLLNRLIQWISPHDICPCHPPSLDGCDEEAEVGIPSGRDQKSTNDHETSRLLSSRESSALYGSHSVHSPAHHCHSYTPDVTCPDHCADQSKASLDDHVHRDDPHSHDHSEAHVHHHHHHHHDNQEEQKQCETLHRRTSVHCHDPVCMADIAAVETETKEKLNLLSVGIQTAVAISIHKFPEGLIMFLGNHVSSSLGLGLFLAIAIHNIPEGLMISIPLYASTGSATKAFLYAGILGGLSQPLGAILGYVLLREMQTRYLSILYGVVFGATSGLMMIIVIQGMLPSAFKYDSQGNTVVVWFLIGILAIGFASASFGHV